MKYLLVAALLAACGSAKGTADAGPGDDASTDAVTSCTAPQMMILLDRTGTMHRDLTGATPTDTPEGHATAKLTLAINALEGLLDIPGIGQSLRFGLAMFPRDPGGGMCLTLSQRLSGSSTFSNPPCEVGEIPVAPELNTTQAIDDLLDPETTTICNTTPTGSGLITARDGLLSVALPEVEQYIVLVTDGADFFDSCPTPDPIETLRTFEADNIKTFIVGFGAQETTPQGVNPPLLNRMACAGRTAKNFETACMALPGGGYDAIDPDGPRLYFDAADGPALSTALAEVAQQVCCGCIL